jgi:hypothetical protein
VTIAAPGFKKTQQNFQLHSSQPVRMGTTLEIGGVTESVTVVAADASKLEVQSRQVQELALMNRGAQMNAPSQNVTNLQKRVAGILPVRIDVPKSGKSYRFVRPLVLEEETRITFQYKSK